MTHGEKKSKFTEMVALLILFVKQQGYDIRFVKEHPNHMKSSLHFEGLAKDFEIRKNGVWLEDTKDYFFAGEFWESLHPLACWGGRFSNPDGCHFSMTHFGRK